MQPSRHEEMLPVRPFCRSREVLETTRSNVCPNFLGDRAKTSSLREVAVDLAVPGGVVALPNKGSQLGQFIGRESVYGSLYLGEAHSGSVWKAGQERNAAERQRSEASKVTASLQFQSTAAARLSCESKAELCRFMRIMERSI